MSNTHILRTPTVARIAAIVAALSVLAAVLTVASAGSAEAASVARARPGHIDAGRYQCAVLVTLDKTAVRGVPRADAMVDCVDGAGYSPGRIWTRFTLKRTGTARAMAYRYTNTYPNSSGGGYYYMKLHSRKTCTKGSLWQGVLTVRVYDSQGRLYNPNKADQIFTTGSPMKVCG